MSRLARRDRPVRPTSGSAGSFESPRRPAGADSTGIGIGIGSSDGIGIGDGRD